MNSGLLEHVKVFVAIAEAGSLTAASIATGIGQATISRQLAALERHLGCRLLHRSTRAVTLTEQGELYLRHAKRMLEINEEAESAIQDGTARLRGSIRVACSNGFGRKLLIPSLTEWQAQHPQVHVELLLADGLTAVIEDQVDVAFRIAPLQRSTLVARAIGTSKRIVVASPQYIRRHGSVSDPTQLQDHECIVFAGAERAGEWIFDGARGKVTVRVQGRLTLSTVDALQDAVLAGLGIAVMPAWFCGRERSDGTVVQLLPGYTLPEQTVHALTSARQKSNGKVRRFVDHVERLLKHLPS